MQSNFVVKEKWEMDKSSKGRDDEKCSPAGGTWEHYRSRMFRHLERSEAFATPTCFTAEDSLEQAPVNV